MSISYETIIDKFDEIQSFSTSPNHKTRHRAFSKYLSFIKLLLEDQSIEYTYSKHGSRHEMTFDIGIDDGTMPILITVIQSGGAYDDFALAIRLRTADRTIKNCIVNLHKRKYNNIIYNVRRIFDTLGDTIKCSLYLHGVQITYDLI